MMSLELANTLSSAVAAIAVVISLIFVGLQLRASVRSQQALAAWQSENSWAQLNFELARDPQAIELMEKINSPETSLELLQGTQLLQAQYMIRCLLQHAQSQYFLFRRGSLSEEDWRHQRNWLVKFVRLPMVVALLKDEIDQAILSSSFLADLEATL
jgi:hypothetical protein